MKRISAVFVSIIMGYFAFSQNFTISGTVKDNNQKVLIGASIAVRSTTIGTISGSDGSYSLVLKPGDYVLVCSYLGYKDSEKTISISGNNTINFTLEETSILSEEIVVSAIKANENTPVAQTNISKQEIEKNNIAADIPYQLALTPSVVATSDNGTGMGYTSMRIRGTDMTRINFSVNGIPLNDSESQGVYWVNMPDFTTSVDNIQIQRGIGTSTNGAAAFGASVNFQTQGIREKAYGELAATIGSFNTFRRSIVAGTGLLNKHFSFDVRYSKLDSDGWIKRGYSDHESFQFSGAYSDKKNLLRGTVLLGEERTGITWWGVPDYMIDSVRNFNPAGQYFDNAGNEHFYEGQSDNYWQNHYQLQYTRKLTKFWNANVALHLTTGEGYYEQYIPEDNGWGSLNTFASYGMPNVSIGDTSIVATDMIRQKWLDNIFYGYTFSTSYKRNNLDISLGSSLNFYDGDHFGKILWTKVNNGMYKDYEWYNNKGKKRDFMAFLKVQYQLMEGLFAFGDIQYRSIDYKLRGPDDDLIALDSKYQWNFLNPKFGLHYTINEHNTIFVSYAKAGREPARADIKNSTKDPNDEAPQSETLHDIELGYNLKFSKIAIGINGFYMSYKDQLVNTGQLNSVGYAIMTNVDNSFRRGIEFVAALKPVKMLQWDITTALSQNKIKNYVEYATHYNADWTDTIVGLQKGTTDISYSPSIVASSKLTFSPLAFLDISFISKYVGEQFIDNSSSNDRKLDTYLVNNLLISATIPLKKLYMKSIDLQLIINNITDTKYSSNAYGGVYYEEETEVSWIYYYPQAPTNVMVKTILKF